MNTFDFKFTAYKVVEDRYDFDKDIRILIILVQSQNRLFRVRLARSAEEIMFRVQSVENSVTGMSLWHVYLERLPGTPILTQVRGEFLIAVVSEEDFPQVVRVITFTSLRSEGLPIAINTLKHILLKKEISSQLLIGYHLSAEEKMRLNAEQARLQEQERQQSEEAERIEKELRYQAKRDRQISIQNRSEIEIVVPQLGKRSGVPVLETEWESLKNGTAAVLMSGEAHATHSLGLPIAYFVVNKERPTRPYKDKFVHLMNAMQKYGV